MATPHRPSFLQRLLRRTEPTPAAADAADLGTAFGLDYVLDQAPPPAALPARPEGQAPTPWTPR